MDASSVRLSGMTFVSSQDGKNELVLRSDRVEIPAGSQEARLEVVELELGANEEMPGMQLTCDRGLLDLATHDVRAEGNVRGRTVDGRAFNTDWLVYSSEKGLVSSDAFVRLQEGAHTLEGKGFKYYVEEDRFVLSGGARVVQGP